MNCVYPTKNAFIVPLGTTLKRKQEPLEIKEQRSLLRKCLDCEFGATAGKVELATCAKKNNLDAIHDTVHEMARDEARHGKALKGLLDRYFGK